MIFNGLASAILLAGEAKNDRWIAQMVREALFLSEMLESKARYQGTKSSKARGSKTDTLVKESYLRLLEVKGQKPTQKEVVYQSGLPQSTVAKSMQRLKL